MCLPIVCGVILFWASTIGAPTGAVFSHGFKGLLRALRAIKDKKITGGRDRRLSKLLLFILKFLFSAELFDKSLFTIYDVNSVGCGFCFSALQVVNSFYLFVLTTCVVRAPRGTNFVCAARD